MGRTSRRWKRPGAALGALPRPAPELWWERAGRSGAHATHAQQVAQQTHACVPLGYPWAQGGGGEGAECRVHAHVAYACSAAERARERQTHSPLAVAVQGLMLNRQSRGAAPTPGPVSFGPSSPPSQAPSLKGARAQESAELCSQKKAAPSFACTRGVVPEEVL